MIVFAVGASAAASASAAAEEEEEVVEEDFFFSFKMVVVWLNQLLSFEGVTKVDGGFFGDEMGI